MIGRIPSLMEKHLEREHGVYRYPVKFRRMDLLEIIEQ